jgi:predicted solute-binding protein
MVIDQAILGKGGSLSTGSAYLPLPLPKGKGKIRKRVECDRSATLNPFLKRSVRVREKYAL